MQPHIKKTSESVKKKPGRPKGSGKTQQVAIRVSTDALSKWRASGRGWQTRAAQLLAEHAPA